MPRPYNIITRYPVMIIAGFVAACAAAVVVHSHYQHYEFSFETMAPTGTQEFTEYRRFIDSFGPSDTIYIIAFRDHDLLRNENLVMIDAITRGVEELAETFTATSLTNVLDVRGEAGTLNISEFVESIPLPADRFASLRARLIADPLAIGNLISEDAETTTIVVRMDEYVQNPAALSAYFDKVQAVLDRYGRAGIKFHLAGGQFMTAHVYRHMVRDSNRMLMLTLLVLGVLMRLAFGQTRAVWMPLVPLVVAAVLTMGTLSGSGAPMTILTGQGVLTVLIIVIGLSDAVHLLNRYREDLDNAAAGGSLGALKSTLSHVGFACFLTSLTTGIGFASLAAADIPTIRDFGIFGAFGIAYAYVAALVCLPALIVVMERRRPSKPRPNRGRDLLDRILAAAAEFAIARPATIIAGGALLLVGSIAAAPLVRIDNRYTEDLRRSDPGVVSLNFLEEHLGGPFPIHIVVRGSRPDAIKDPGVLADMAAVEEELVGMPEISKVISPALFVKKMNRAMNDDHPEAYTLPATRESVAQYLLLFEMDGGDSEFDRLVTYDYSTAIIEVFAYNITPEQYEMVLDRLTAVTKDRFEGLEVVAAGNMALFHSIATRLISTLIRSLYLAMPLIFIVTCLTFRSLKLGLVAMIPNLLPLTVGLGFLGLSDISLRFATMVGFPVAFGLAVDDTIHLLVRYREEIAAGRTIEDAIRVSLATSGRAMLMTTVFLIAGFSVMLTSSFLAAIHISMVICVILAAALLGDLLLLPALLVKMPTVSHTLGRPRSAQPTP